MTPVEILSNPHNSLNLSDQGCLCVSPSGVIKLVNSFLSCLESPKHKCQKYIYLKKNASLPDKKQTLAFSENNFV